VYPRYPGALAFGPLVRGRAERPGLVLCEGPGSSDVGVLGADGKDVPKRAGTEVGEIVYPQYLACFLFLHRKQTGRV
jgi:hypothetical protein